MKYIKLFEDYATDYIVNNSFGVKQSVIEDYLEFLMDEYRLSYDDEYIVNYKETLLSILKKDYSYNDDGVLIGVENFPQTITLYRLIDNTLDNIKSTNYIGRSWTYNKEIIKDIAFQSSIGFDDDKPWYVVTGVFNKDDIDGNELCEVLVRLQHEKELRVKYNHNPISYKITEYENF